MIVSRDAYRHHPELHALVTPPEDSFFRDLDIAAMDARMAALGRPADWRRTHEDRERTRHDLLADVTGPVWVFAYGSLMWDPAIVFDEVRHARISGYHRSMCLVDRRGPRGNEDAPGLMAGLAPGGKCDGLAFRIPADQVDHETERLWRREMIAHAYDAAMAPARTALGDINVVTFVANDATDYIDLNLPRDTQVEYIATGSGFLGTSLEYLENTVRHFQTLNIQDDALMALLADARARAARNVDGHVDGQGGDPSH